MWTELNSGNINQIKRGTLICQKHPSLETIRVNDITTTLETIYEVERIEPGIEGIGDITLKTKHLAHANDIAGTRVVNKPKLINENWYAFLN